MMAAIETVTIAAPDGRTARILSYGARLQSLTAPDRHGQFTTVVLGHDDPEAYRRDPFFLGAVVGRYANRIARGRYTLDGRAVRLDINDGVNHLHGGRGGFHARDWTVVARDPRSVTLELVSNDGDQGYPGTLIATARYAFADDGALTLDLSATTDAPTIVNLSHHPYWDLSGVPRADGANDHLLTIAASRFTPVDDHAIPTGEQRAVANTPFDFRAFKPIGRDIGAADHQLGAAGGYDHNFILDSGKPAARLSHPASGRVLVLDTDAPGLQFYSGNALTLPRSALCLEPQHFPDSPNRPDFPSTRIEPGQTWRRHTRYQLGVSLAD